MINLKILLSAWSAEILLAAWPVLVADKKHINLHFFCVCVSPSLPLSLSLYLSYPKYLGRNNMIARSQQLILHTDELQIMIHQSLTKRCTKLLSMKCILQSCFSIKTKCRLSNCVWMYVYRYIACMLFNFHYSLAIFIVPYTNWTQFQTSIGHIVTHRMDPILIKLINIAKTPSTIQTKILNSQST